MQISEYDITNEIGEHSYSDVKPDKKNFICSNVACAHPITYSWHKIMSCSTVKPVYSGHLGENDKMTTIYR